VVLAYAEQTGRSFFRHNHPIDVTLKDIPSDCELREQKLPDEADWTVALKRAKDIFGVSVAALRKASTVAELETKVRQIAKARIEACQGYAQVLQESLEDLAVDKDCDRLTTATTTLAMLEQLSAASDGDGIEVLASVMIATSEAAMAECLKKAATLTGTLEGVSWDIFQGITALRDKRQPAAQTILNGLTKALSSDEHVIALALQIKQSQNQAVRLLTQQPAPSPSNSPVVIAPPISPPPVVPPSSKVVNPEDAATEEITITRTISEGSQTDIGFKAAQDMLITLGKDLKPGQNVRLSISWIIEETLTQSAPKENRHP
jgi:hypothetical protein